MSGATVASVALGSLARENSLHENWIQSLWTAFLLLHLGGPDTITAYSLEDNELWPRQLLDALFHIGVAIYVSLKSWGDIRIVVVALPVFITGARKYNERTWVLKLSSTRNLRNFLISHPDPGPDYPGFMEKKQGNADLELPSTSVPPQRYSGSPDDYLSQAYYLFNRFTYLFSDLILGYDERQDCHSIICNMSPDEAFELVEGELGLLYDALYNKLTALHFRYRGYRRRCFTLFASLFSLISFSYMNSIDHKGQLADILITYLLLFGAVTLEVYGFVFLILSDWTKLWLLQYVKADHVRIGKRWSRKISKVNMIKFRLRTLDQDTMWNRFLRKLNIEENVAKSRNVEYQEVDAELKSLIFQELKHRSENINSFSDVKSCKKLLSYRGDSVLCKMECLLKWSTTDVEFDHSLLLWHIATQLCYYDDVKRPQGSNSLGNLKQHSKISKGLSEYMMYLLVMCPNMLPKGIGEISFKDTCAEAKRFFRQKRNEIRTEVDGACCKLSEVDTDLLEQVKGDMTKPVLFYGTRLAKQLQTLDFEKNWELMNQVWVELVTYAAAQCGWTEHGQQLRRGGELLTHVCLLMAHLGLSEQYQTQKQYFRIPQERRREKPPFVCRSFLKLLGFVYR